MKPREKIKQRMLKYAARIWGYEESQMEKEAFDPVVNLLFEACAMEFERIELELATSENRVFERILDTILPNSLSSAFPAHAVLYLPPSTSNIRISKSEMFTYTIKTKENPFDVYFSPINTCNLIDGKVSYLAAGESLIKVEEYPKRVEIATSMNQNKLESRILWLGIKVSDECVSARSLSLFFNWKAVSVHKLFEHLSQADWFCGYQRLNVRNETNWQMENENENWKGYLENEYDVISKIENNIQQFYKKHFYTVALVEEETPLELSAWNRALPFVFTEIFPKKDLDKLDKDLIWISIHFPEQEASGFLTKTECFLNCFPVLNRGYHKENHRIREALNIVALDNDDLFLAIDKIVDDNENEYKSTPFAGFRNLEKGSFTLRKKGVNKFNQRDASRAIRELIGLLRDDFAAFSAFNQEYLSRKLISLQEEINELENAILINEEEHQHQMYVIVKPLSSQKNNLEFCYWSTQGEKANGIPSGSILSPYHKLNLKNNEHLLVTSSIGGSKEKHWSEKKANLLKVLVNKDRIVSEEDIRIFCFSAFGDDLQDIYFKKSYRISDDIRISVEKIMEVHLKFPNLFREEIKKETMLNRVELLNYELNEKSASIIPIVLIIDEPV